jgi:hypothetical protein
MRPPKITLVIFYCCFIESVLPESALIRASDPVDIVQQITKQVESWQSHFHARIAHFECEYRRTDVELRDLRTNFFTEPPVLPTTSYSGMQFIEICDHDVWNYVKKSYADAKDGEFFSAFFNNDIMSVSRKLEKDDDSTTTPHLLRVVRKYHDKRESIWGSPAAPFYGAFGLYDRFYPHELWQSLTFSVLHEDSNTITLAAETTQYKINLTCSKLENRFALIRHEIEGYIDPERYSYIDAGVQASERRICIFRYVDALNLVTPLIPVQCVSQTAAIDTSKPEVHFVNCTLTSDSEKLGSWPSYGKLCPQVKNGNEVYVDGYQGIAFEWQDGEVVRRIDGKRLAELEGRERSRSSVRSILYLICFAIVAVIAGRITIQHFRKTKA